MNASNPDQADVVLMTDIAVLYYLESRTQEEISQQLDLSRAKVGRLLKRAREEGIVDVRVLLHPSVSAELSGELTRRFGIDRALVGIDHPDPDTQRSIVAGLVATHLNRSLRDGMIVAVGMGRNVRAVADSVVAQTRKACTFVCAVGGSVRAGESMNPDHICRRFAARFGGESETLYAPALVADKQLRAALFENDTVRETLDRARRADVGLFGVGDLSENSNMVRMGWFSPQEIAEARLSGTIGDMMGYDFFDIHGNPAAAPIQERVVGMTTAELRRIPDVIAVASEKTKAAAILGALRMGVINTLATSATNAHTIIKLDDATHQGRASTGGQGAAGRAG